jgi:hypothetical protein
MTKANLTFTRVLVLPYLVFNIASALVIFGPVQFLFFTNLCWIGIIVYQLLVIRYSLLPNPPTYYTRLIRILFACCTTLALIVTIVFWSMLSGAIEQQDGGFQVFLLLNTHTFNLVYVLFELIATRQRFEGRDYIWPCMCMLLYVPYVGIWFGISGKWPYPFLERVFQSGGWVILGSFLGSLLACFVAFQVCALMIRVRDFYFWPVVFAVPPTEMKRRKSSKKTKKIQKSAVVENCDE